MQIKLNHDRRIVEVWLTKAETDDPATQARLKPMYTAYKQQKYLVCVFQSGRQDMYPCVRDMLAYNKRKIAENAMICQKRLHLADTAR